MWPFGPLFYFPQLNQLPQSNLSDQLYFVCLLAPLLCSTLSLPCQPSMNLYDVDRGISDVSEMTLAFISPFLISLYPRNEVRGVYWNHHVRLSVCPSAFGFPAHNCFPFTPIIMKLHMQTPHEARMCPIDFEVKRSKVKVTMHKLLKMVSGA